MNYVKMIDHTLLKADATKQQIEKLCSEAKEYGFYSVCVNSGFVAECKELLRDSEVKVCTVVGFPLGAMSREGKTMEAQFAIDDGADEIDMVINIGRLKSGEWDYVKGDIESVIQVIKGKAILKVILEICLLTEEELRQACIVCKELGVDFVKTSTGFSKGGATVEAVSIMRQMVGNKIGVKASGGVKTLEDVEKMIQAGANRIGTSSGVQIIKSVKGNSL